jgi:hypothetical protein
MMNFLIFSKINNLYFLFSVLFNVIFELMMDFLKLEEYTNELFENYIKTINEKK